MGWSDAKERSFMRQSPPPCTSSVFRRATAFAASDVVVVLIWLTSLRSAPLSVTDRSYQPRTSISLRVPDHTRGDPSRPCGILASSEARAAAAASTESTLSTIPESVGPGLMALTRTPCSASSDAVVRASGGQPYHPPAWLAPIPFPLVPSDEARLSADAWILGPSRL